MLRPDHLARRQTQGRAFGQPAILIRFSPGSRDARGRWVSGGSSRIAITLAQAPVKDARSVDVDGVAQRDVRIFHMHGIDVDSIRVGRGANEGDQIEFFGDVYRITDIGKWEDSHNSMVIATGILIDPRQ